MRGHRTFEHGPRLDLDGPGFGCHCWEEHCFLVLFLLFLYSGIESTEYGHQLPIYAFGVDSIRTMITGANYMPPHVISLHMGQ